jgi:hypothetical protein
MQRHQKCLLVKLEKARYAWVNELPSVLWSLQTTPNVATQETPFFLVHVAEAVLPIEIEHNSPRVVNMTKMLHKRCLKTMLMQLMKQEMWCSRE